VKAVQDRVAVWAHRVQPRMIAGFAYLLLTVAGSAQQLQAPSLPSGLPSASPPGSSRAASATEDDKANAKDINNGGSISSDSNATLTARQIIAILEARPELIVDIKQVMADYLVQQGNPLQVDSITDDMLYRGIGSDAGLRGTISIWLRARGYVSDSDFDKSDMDPKSSDDVTGMSTLGLPNSLVTGGAADSARVDSDRLQTNSPNVDGVQGKRNLSKQPQGRDVSSAATADRNNPSAVEVVRQTTPYNLQSLRDLYTQLPEQTSKLKRFGSDMF
jgi:hypothetical protein